ncbi:MAG TPA: radical SAM protein [Thermoanaerobaculia bacterium]|nr:radical SAM protein [Thermoanaerobaculia bacterium]
MIAKAASLFVDPVTAEKRALMASRWSALDPALRLPGQGLGRKATGCGATMGIQPKCDFSCTGCYLGADANRIPAMPVDAVLRQLDELRHWLGPKSNVQITDGEVTLRPAEELIEILRYARGIGIIPMVMTHGDNLRRQPGLLERLMSEGELTEISIHIDVTQRGRDGHRAPKSERELMPLRDEFADLIRVARRKTKRRLRVAHTMTVTSENLGDVPDVVHWMVRNRDAFSLISFQPLAQVGRTRRGLEGVTPQQLWTAIGRATREYGLEVHDAEPMHFGHPECTRFVPLLAVQPHHAREPRLVQCIRNEPEDVAVMQEFFEKGLGGVAFRDDSLLEALARGAGMLVREPRWFLGTVRRWFLSRLRFELGMSVRSFLRHRIDGLTLTSHHFMSPAELATDHGRARLDACVFRIPVKGEMVPMCQVNGGGVRERFYEELI